MSADTIFALASGRPPAAVSIIRISGPRAHDVARGLAGKVPESRRASLRTLRDEAGEPLDEALILCFAGPASATGEDTVEFHCHGGRAVVDAILRQLSSLQGLRLAQPGEFTRRAFENGRIDLTEAEGLADLIEAETDSQRRAALRLAEGGLRRQVDEWLQRLLQLSARAEAAIDYVEEEDVTPDRSLSRDCGALASELKLWLDRPRMEPLKDGVRVVVAGPPNAGKSSLINAIIGQDRVIVTDIPGTTRDQIDVPMSLDGIPILLTDTAGLRETDELVERIGVDRARSLLETADILLWLGEPKNAPPHAQLVLVHAQADRPDRRDAPAGSMPVSSKTAEGMAELLARVGEIAPFLLPAEDAIALNRRQAAGLSDARLALDAAASADDHVLLAEDLRSARGAFDRMTGRAGVEDVLDALFGRFCLGK